MTGPAVDHVIVMVRDLDAAADRWTRLGFTTTPRGFHSAHMGTANHCLMFGSDYVELIGVVTPTPANGPWRAQLDRREGAGGLALATNDAQATEAALAGEGISAGQVLDFARPVRFEGGTGEAAFAVARATGFAEDGLDLFFCQHRTRDLVWRPEWQGHANGALALARVDFENPDPAAFAARLAKVFGRDAIGEEGDALIVASGSVPLRIVVGAEARMTGFAVRVADLDRTAEALETGAIAHVHRPRSIEVAPAEANGVALSFVEA
jgi:catechol 2,3-dioxygenase-like lactoylglutathione lyase family enzyme